MKEHFSDVGNIEFLVKIVLTVTALFIALGGPIAGFTIDRWGRKPLLVISISLFSFVGASGFLIDSVYGILATRAVLGLITAGIMTSNFTLVADYFSGRERAQMVGSMAGIFGVSALVVVIVGGLLADYSWRAPFLIYLVGLAPLPLVLRYIYEPTRVKGAALLSESTAVEKPSIQTKREPIPVKLFAAIYGIGLIANVLFFMIHTQLPFYLEDLGDTSGLQVGIAIADINIFNSLTALMYGWMSARLDVIRMTALGFCLMGAGYLVIGLASSYGIILVGLAVAGLGLGVVLPNLITWIASVSPLSVRGRAMGGLTSVFFLGHFLSPIISEPLVRRTGAGDAYVLAGFLMMSMVAVFAAIHIKAPSANMS